MLDYVSKVVLTEHAKFRLFAPLKKDLKKERGKKIKLLKGGKYRKIHLLCVNLQ